MVRYNKKTYARERDRGTCHNGEGYSEGNNSNTKLENTRGQIKSRIFDLDTYLLDGMAGKRYFVPQKQKIKLY